MERRKASLEKKLAVGTAITAVVVASALAAWWWLHRPDAMARSMAQLQPVVALAVARLEIVDMAGKERPGGVAVAVDEGVAVAPCDDVAPGAQLRLLSGAGAHPARVAQSDGRGRCRLAVTGGAGFPLRPTSVAPAAGETIYVPIVSLRGETTLRAGRVSRVEDSGGERIIVVDGAASGISAGTPLIDRHGRLAGFAWRDGVARFTVAPLGWLEGGKMSSERPSS